MLAFLKTNASRKLRLLKNREKLNFWLREKVVEEEVEPGAGRKICRRAGIFLKSHQASILQLLRIQYSTIFYFFEILTYYLKYSLEVTRLQICGCCGFNIPKILYLFEILKYSLEYSLEATRLQFISNIKIQYS